MKEEMTLGMAVKKIAWAYILIHAAINIGVIDILPDWLAFYFMLVAIRKIREEEESIGLLEPLAKILLVWNVLIWGTKIAGWDLSTFPFAIVFSVIGIYFHFQMLTNLASVAEKHGSYRGKGLLVARTVETVMNTVLTSMVYLQIEQGWMIGAALVAFIATICICCVLFGLAKELENEVMA